MSHRLPSHRLANSGLLSLLAAASVALALATSHVAASGSADRSNELAVRAAAREADVVVLGTISGLESHWAGKRIVTVAELRVERTVKGRPGASVRVAVLGGHVERPVPMSMIVADAPSLAEGEEALFFLTASDSGDDSFSVRSKLPVATDRTTGEKRVLLGERPIPLEVIEKKQREQGERASRKPSPAERRPR